MGYSAEAEPDPTTRDRVRSGPVRAAVDRMLRDLTGKRTTALALREFPASQVVAAILAQRYATAVDRAVDSSDDGRLIAAGEKLRAVLGSLEPKPDPMSGGGSPDDGRASSGGHLYSILDRGPAVGDTANA